MKKTDTSFFPEVRPKSGTLILWTVLLTYGLYALSSLGLGSFYVYCATDVLLGTSILPILIDFLIDLIQTLLIPAAAWAFICFAEFGRRSTPLPRALFGLYLGSLVLCRVFDLGISLILYGSLSATELLSAVWYLVLDLIFAGILYWIFRHRAKRFRHEEQIRQKASAALNRGESVKTEPSPVYPFPLRWDRSNPLQSCLILFSIILSAVKIVQRILYDIVYSIDSGALPALGEIPVMIVYYLSDLLAGICFWAIGLLIYRILFRKKQEK